MVVYLIRHTTPQIASGICYGQSNIEVTASFQEEAAIIAQQLPLDTIERVYSSPLQRCTQLANTFNITPVHLDSGLLEMNFGDWELQAWDTIPKQELQPWMDNFVTASVPNGESYEILQERVLRCMDTIVSHSHTTIAIVTHAGPIRALLAHLREIPLSESFEKIPIAYGAVFKIEL